MSRERWWRRHLAALLIAATLAVVALMAVLTTIPGPADQPLDPASTSLTGGAALASVLEDHGVDIHVVRSSAELQKTPVDRFTTVVVTSSDALGPETTRHVAYVARSGLLVVVGPTPLVAEELEVPLTGQSAGQRAGNCDLGRFDKLEMSTVSGAEFDTTWNCFAEEGGGWLGYESDHLALLGPGEILSNGEILAADNAAIALTLLGNNPDLVWYIPDPADSPGSVSATMRDVVPRWLWPALLMVSLAVLGTMIWRGRRMGPVLQEPLPVSVKAIETTVSRGRIYRRAGDRFHAARGLRSATKDRLLSALHLPPGIDDSALFAQLSAISGQSPEEIARVLSPQGRRPLSDRELITLAQDLAALEEGITRDH